MVNPLDLFRLKGIWDRLQANHPKMLPFIRSVYPAAIGEGTIIDIRVTDPAGKVYRFNMRLSAEDMAGINEAHEIGRGAAPNSDH